MEKAKRVFEKLAPAISACMALVLIISANSSTCYVFNQPDPPKGFDGFKRIK